MVLGAKTWNPLVITLVPVLLVLKARTARQTQTNAVMLHARTVELALMVTTPTRVPASMGFQEPIAKLMSTVVLLRRVKTVQHA